MVPKMKIAKALVYFAFISLIAVIASAQTTSPQSQISQPIDESKLTVLRGNTHPLARAQFDRGSVSPSLPMGRMILLLKTTPAQQSALDTLLAEQQDKSSPNYHKWLTPQEFGEQFGTSQADIQKVSTWLGSHGFQIDNVANGRNVILFSGNAAQVQAAFHTAIHNYSINGRNYWANASDPAIPTALTPAVAGVVSLNNFPRRAAHRLAGTFEKNAATHKFTPKAGVKPAYTFAGGCQGTSGSDCYGVAPYDLAAIYNILPLWNASPAINGSGETIAIVSDTDINTADFTNFRSIFGLPAGTLNQIHNGADPGILGGSSCTGSDCDESEAALDVQWSGAVAPGATIDLVISPSGASFGADLSAQYVIDGHDTNNPKILGYSYSQCEFYFGTAGNQFYGGSTFVDGVSGEWKQAAAEGITVVVASGDDGATACDAPSGSPALDEPSQLGLAVNGIASTPYNVAVGGTDFDDATNPTTYWDSSNASNQQSVKGYIPEVTYNDTCTNLALDALISSSSTQDAETNCNTFFNSPASSTGSLEEFVITSGGGGGPSNCITSNYNFSNNTGSLASCTAGYAKPTWQTGTGVPADGKRDLPDISAFSGDGTLQNFYVYCEQDLDTNNAACSLSEIQGVGGTSVATQVFAGMMALLNQGSGSAQGLPNSTLYTLAAQSWANCTSSGTLNSSCIFYQVTSGTISMPCVNQATNFGSPLGCTIASSGDTVGTTEANGAAAYSAAAGYNMATGLGSLNVYNLVKEWSIGSGGAADFVIQASPAAVNIASTGGTGTTTLTIVPVNGFTGAVSFASTACSGLPSGASCSFSSSSVNASGTTTLTITAGSSTTSSPSIRLFGPGRWTRTVVASLCFVLAIGAILFFTRARQRQWSMAAACAVFVLLTLIAACGGSGNSSPPPPPPPPSGAVTPAAVTITGTSGTTTRTTTVMLTVQ
jgi:subtilase family serine protease